MLILCLLVIHAHALAHLGRQHHSRPVDEIGLRINAQIQLLRDRASRKSDRFWFPRSASKATDTYFSGIQDNQDIPFINNFLDRLKLHHLPLKTQSALDCAAGSGRITDLVLNSRFQVVDLFQMNPLFVQMAQKRLKGTPARYFYVSTLQDFNFRHSYDLIFAMYSITYLNEEEALLFLRKCRDNLNEKGVAIVLENHSAGDYEVNQRNGQLSRSSLRLGVLYSKSEFRVVLEDKFPVENSNLRIQALV